MCVKKSQKAIIIKFSAISDYYESKHEMRLN